MTEEVLDPSRTRAFSQSTDIRVDWFRLLAQLKAEGYSLYAVSHFTEIPKGTLIGYKQGSQPLYQNGVRLVAFWAQSMEKDVAEVPTISPYSHMA